MRFSAIALALIMSFSFHGLAEDAQETGGAARPVAKIIIGATFPRTGFLEDYGLSAYYGAIASLKKVNASGGINGKELVIEWRDNQSDSAIAVKNVRELVSYYKVPVMLGPLMSDCAMRVKPLARELGVVVVSPMSTADALVEKDPWLFRCCFNNSAEAEALVKFQRDKFGARSCAILFDPRYTFSREMARVFELKARMAGIASVGRFEILDEQGELDYDTPLRRIAEKKPDFIFAPTYALEATEMIRAAGAAGIRTPFCGHYTWDSQLVFEGSGSRLAGTSFASALFEQASSRMLREFFTAMGEAGMDNPDAAAACAYDAVTLIANALRQGEKPEDIRKALLDVRDFPLVTGRTSITDEGDTIKPVLVRLVERTDWHLVPVYAERYDPPRRPADRRR